MCRTPFAFVLLCPVCILAARPANDVQCPVVQPRSNADCTLNTSISCGYGMESCCGSDHYSTSASCDGFTSGTNGTWALVALDSCFLGCATTSSPHQSTRPANDALCPVAEPSSGADCTLSASISCGYGIESCNGNDYYSTSASCDTSGTNGTWVRMALDSCEGPGSPPSSLSTVSHVNPLAFVGIMAVAFLPKNVLRSA
mmetsp:Transcript_59208/g.92168  ORF Transcript_59208/g.92168 Transcript_59208/m.92168 type:complete len:200 (-) Transcript_59208:194-793(-)